LRWHDEIPYVGADNKDYAWQDRRLGRAAQTDSGANQWQLDRLLTTRCQ
jgi:hypothetical protein